MDVETRVVGPHMILCKGLGHEGVAYFDSEDGEYHGRVVTADLDIVTYVFVRPDDAGREFLGSLRDYQEFCHEQVSPRLERLVEKARAHEMSPEEVRGQKISFAYGNGAMSEPNS